MRPNRLRTTVSTLVLPREIYYKWQWYESCANCFPSRIEPFSFPKHKAGAFLQNRALSSLFAIVAIASSLSAGKLWARSQAEEAGGAQTQAHAPEEPDASCIGATVGKISFPGVDDNDQKMLRDMLPVKEGSPLDRGQLQESMRLLFATGRFADLRAECERTPEGKIMLSFPNTPKYFIGLVRVEGAPGRPTESQMANASKLQLGEPFTKDKINRAVENIKSLLQENEFYNANISFTQHENPQTQQVEIIFDVHSGDQARVGAIAIQGGGIYSLGQIEDIAHLHPGDIVSAQKVSDALDRVRKHYQKRERWLTQVGIASKTYNPQLNTVDYKIDIEVGPRVEIRAEGFSISKAALKRNVPVYEEHALDDDLLNEGRRNLIAYMEGRGYSDATVTLKREADDQGKVLRVTYQIDAGERHKLVKVRITGNKYFREADLRPLLPLQTASLAQPHGTYSQALLRSGLRDIENMYRANGFAQVKVDTQVEDNYRGVQNQLAVTVTIEEGPQTQVGTFQIVGSTQADNPTFQNLYTGPGQPFSDSRIADDRDIILNYYFDNGFPDATFEAEATPASGNRMNVVFKIHEGERFYIDRVLVSGREYTRPYVIDHELQMKPGDPLSQGDLLRSQQKLYDLGIFSQVDTAVQDPEGVQPRKNVLVEVQEARRYTFNYGAGFEFQTGQAAISGNGSKALGETGVSPLASLDVTRLNFRGRDHTITFESRVGGLQQRGLISYEAPRWFNNPDWKLSLTAFFDHTLDVTTFTSQRLEGSVQAEQILSHKADGTPVSVMNYRFNYRLVKATNVQVSADQIPLLSLPVRVGEPGFSYLRNHRDNDLETTRGSYNSIDGGVAASYFGSQADFSRVLIQNSTYHPFGKVNGRQFVFARSTRIGLENAFANTIITQPGQNTPANFSLIPLPERFFMGGGNSHRGFGLNQAGPRDPATGFPIGGSALFLNNLEIRFPPASLPFVHDNLSFAIFEDMGNVFTDGSHMLDSLLRWHQNKGLCVQRLNTTFQAGSGATLCNYDYISNAVGLGVRYKTPVGPVRFDFGYNLNPTVFPNFCMFMTTTKTCPAALTYFGTKQASHFNVYFSIGQTF
jgi:outer membrane protein assembly complex protein YaeT